MKMMQRHKQNPLKRLIMPGQKVKHHNKSFVSRFGRTNILFFLSFIRKDPYHHPPRCQQARHQNPPCLRQPYRYRYG